MVCLVNSVNERDLNLLNSTMNFNLTKARIQEELFLFVFLFLLSGFMVLPAAKKGREGREGERDSG